jgi:membrane protein
MNIRHIKLIPLLKATVTAWYADNCLRLGASLSYYTLFSLFPLILVVLTVVRLLISNSEAARDAILLGLTSVTGGFRDEFIATLEAASKTRRTSSVIGLLTLIVGASWVFGELVSAFNIIWRVDTETQSGLLAWLRLTFFSFALILAAVFLLLVSMIISALLTTLGHFTEALPGGTIMGMLTHGLINLIVLTGVFTLLFKYLPRTRVRWQDVWLGGLLTAITWSILQYGIAYYISVSSYKDYGAVGSMLALVAWVYLSSQVLFLGGEFTAVYARMYGSRARQERSGASNLAR